MMSKKLTPVQTAIKHFEDYFVNDLELQKRYDQYKRNEVVYKERIGKILPGLKELQDDKSKLEDLIVQNSLVGAIVEVINKEYFDVIERLNAVGNEYNENRTKQVECIAHIQQLEGLSSAKYSVAYNMISILDKEIRKKGFPEWKKQYGDRII